MKKIVLASVGVILALGMTGCSSNSASQSVKNLNEQLDRVNNAVVFSVSDDASEIANTTSSTTSNLNYLRNKAYNDLLEERYLKDEILSLSSYLKSNQSTKYKLAKSDINALKSLADDLNKYSTCLNDSKSTVKSCVKKIKNQSRTDSEHVSSSYQVLSNIMNERKAYLNNLLNTMNEIAGILYRNDVISSQDNSQNNAVNFEQNGLNSSNYQTQDYNSFNNQYYLPNHFARQPQGFDYHVNKQRPVKNSESENNQTSSNPKGLTKNIDTYNAQNLSDNIEDNNNADNNNIASVNNSKNDNFENNIIDNNNINRPINNGYPHKYNQHEGYYGNPYYNNPYYNGYNNYYNPNFSYNRHGFNPGRNTDTYYPLNRNIDTYRVNPNQYALNTANMDEKDNDKNSIVERIEDQQNTEAANNKNGNPNQEETPKIKHVIRRVKQETVKNNNNNLTAQNKNELASTNSDTKEFPNKLTREEKVNDENKIKPVENIKKEALLNDMLKTKNETRSDTLNNDKAKQKNTPIKIENRDSLMSIFIKDDSKNQNDKNNHLKEKIGTVQEVQFT